MSTPGSPKYTSEWAALGARVAKTIAWVSGLFSLVLCVVVIMNQIQIMMTPPLDDPALKALKAAIAKDQENQQLRDSARVLSVMARRAFFTSAQQLRVGGLLLVVGVAIFLASMKSYVELTLRLPLPIGMPPKEGGTTERAAGRWAVTAGGGLLVVFCLVFALVSPPAIYFENFIDAKPAGSDAKAPDGGAGTPSTAVQPGPTPGPKDATPSAAAGAPKPVPADAWPVFRGPYGLGVAGHKNAPLKWDGKSGENIRWKVEIPKVGRNSVVVWGKRAFVSGGDETKREVYCFEADSGKLLWTGDDSAIPGSTPPSIKVSEDTGFSASTLATDGEQVYAVFANGTVMAFTMEGKRAWAWTPGAFKINYGYGSSLNVAPGRVLVQFDHQGGGHLIALDAKTGKVVYDVKRDVKSSWATPVVVNTGKRWETILNAPPFVMGHDLETGKILWKIECMADTEVAPSPGFSGGIAVAAQERAALVGIQTGGEARLLWKMEDDLPDVSSPVVSGKYVIMAASGGMVTCLEAATGKKFWTKEFDDGFYSSPVVVDDRVYLMDKAGVTVVFKLGEKYEELAKNVLGEKAGCTPAIPEGRIYFRSDRFLYCIGKGGS